MYQKAQLGIQHSGVRGEILVADNGSKHDSVLIAEKLGTRVVHIEKKGYGNALRGGIQAASGKWIIIGDADESYDFSETDRFVKKFQEGFELVAGCGSRAEAAKFCREQCDSHIAGSVTRSFREWPDICLPRLFTMSIGGCAGSHGQSIID